MQKDYHVIGETDSELSETEHIARHWTAIWDKLRASGWNPRQIRDNEKYRLMEPHLDTLSRGARILDGGCGLGQWVLALDDAGFSATGLDLSTQTVQFLSERFHGHRFIAGDIRNLPLENSSYDAYLSWGTFEHFEQGMNAPITEARRVLKSGGLLFITVPFQNLRQIIRGAPRVPPDSAARFYQWRFTKQELRTELELRGFDVLSVVPVSKTEGVSRAVEHDLHVPRRSVFGKILIKILRIVLPGFSVGHMLFAVAKKR